MEFGNVPLRLLLSKYIICSVVDLVVEDRELQSTV
uniref:Uncharacterized protein n=1 Tax=Arundo donax TaxID=35708 RepID=A0A0A9B6Z7_ARUDO